MIHEGTLANLQSVFSDPEAVANYAEGPPRFMPGYHDMQRMAGILLAERASIDGRILVVGAGGGLEIKAWAKDYPDWLFWGIDPSAQMISLAAQMLEGYSSRVSLIEGYVNDAPNQLFDGAACLLTLHFLDQKDRLKTVLEVHRRLTKGAPFVVAHMSFSHEQSSRDTWLDRYAAFALIKSSDPDLVATFRKKVGSQLNILTPDEDVEILRAAGFVDITPFYHGLTWRDWVGYAR